MKTSLSVVIPAYNEEKNLRDAVRAVFDGIGNRFESYEIFIINDGSADKTGEIAEHLANDNPNIKVIHHRPNRGLGYSVRSGYDKVTKEYTMWYPGDNGMMEQSLAEMMKYTGQADIIIPYIADTHFRSFFRRMVSRAYVMAYNLIFGLKIRYYNGVNIYRSDLVKTTQTSTDGFAMFAEHLIRIVKQGCTYIEVPTYHRQRVHGTSKAFRFKNLWGVAKTLFILIWDIHVLGKYRYAKAPLQKQPVAIP